MDSTSWRIFHGARHSKALLSFSASPMQMHEICVCLCSFYDSIVNRCLTFRPRLRRVSKEIAFKENYHPLFPFDFILGFCYWKYCHSFKNVTAYYAQPQRQGNEVNLANSCSCGGNRGFEQEKMWAWYQPLSRTVAIVLPTIWQMLPNVYSGKWKVEVFAPLKVI